MASVYLASRMKRKLEMQDHAKDLRLVGIEVVSRWIYAHEPFDADHTDDAAHSIRDLDDIDICTDLIIFTEPKPAGHNGRLTEAGYAWGAGKDIYAVGSIEGESIFFRHPDIRVFEDWPQALATLAVTLH